MKKDSEATIGRVPREWLELFRENEHHIRAKEILKDAIQMAMNSPEMTPEVKDTADFFILLLDETSFKYDSDALMEPVVKIVEKDTKSNSGKNAAKARHANDYKLHEEIKRVWSEGNFSSRDLCAEQEYSSLGFKSFKAARNALRNTPDPSSWPAKTIKK